MRPPCILVVMGVSGSGKSTVAAPLARRLGWVFQEGDALHPPTNIAKMKAGEALTDADRAPWLDAIGAWMDARARAGEGGVVTCSALRRVYRDRLRQGRPRVGIVYLEGSRKVIAERLASRRGHFMPPALLDSQLDTLEEPAAAEDAIVVDITRPVETQVRRVIETVRERGWA